jgi:hypothetical protein
MSTISHHTISLDGFIAGHDDSMDWAFAYGEPTSLAEETMNRIGAIVAGRRWYELARERWGGVDGIYHGAFQGSVIVITHRPPEEAGDPRISFVSAGIEEAVAAARPPPAKRTWGSSAGASPGNVSRLACSTRSFCTSRQRSSAAGCASSTARGVPRASSSGSRWAKPITHRSTLPRAGGIAVLV